MGQGMRKKLAEAFSPDVLEIVDNSAQHAGHAGVRGPDAQETHFTIRLVSSAFEGESRVSRQRRVYALLADEFAQGLHALSLSCDTPAAAPAAVPRPPPPVAVVSDAPMAPTLSERLVAESPDLVKAALSARRSGEEQLEAVDRIGQLTRARAELVATGDDARAQRKKLSPQIGKLLKEGKAAEAEELKADVAEAAATAAEADAELEALDAQRAELFAALPNLLDPRVTDGASEEDNVVVSEWGCEDLPAAAAWHDDFGSLLGLDLEAAAQLSGARFSVLRGDLARLERALINFFLDTHAANGYTEVMVPYIVGREALEGTGQLPKFEEDLFQLKEPVNGRQSFLIPTAEVPITNLHAGDILDEASLPMSYCAVTPCFRAEAGSYGKDTKGLFRQHQFHKVELVKLATPEQADAAHAALVADAEKVLQALELPYRKVQLCSGDTGFSARLCYDLEVWLPGQQKFREISSCSNCADFQARRMNLRYRPAGRDAKGKEKKPAFCHTMNGSGLAVGRTLVAILENYQNSDGSLTIPTALRPYMRGEEKILPIS